MNDSNDIANARPVATSAKTMSPRGQFVVATVFSLLSIGWALILADRAFTEVMTIVTRKSAVGTVTKVEQTRGRSGTANWVYYSFDVGGTRYERSWMFGLFKQATQIDAADVRAFPQGAPIDVFYSSRDPRINVPVNDPYRNDKSGLMMLGSLLFGFLALHLFKDLMKKAYPR